MNMPGERMAVRWTRRAWLTAALAAGTTRWVRGAQLRAAADDAEGEAAVLKRAEEAGLKGFSASRNAYYVGIGDAPGAFRIKALEICRFLANDYLNHFKFKGFTLHPPGKKMIVVVLAGAKSYEAFSGQQAVPGIGGHYEPDSNRLVIFDNRPQPGADKAQAERDNLISLVHEAMHQLTFNTGLLERQADVPVAISEGFGTYAEPRNPNGSTQLGKVNPWRIEALRLAEQERVPWIPLTKLLTQDTIFQGDGGQTLLQRAYAQSWLLIFELMRPNRPTALHDYLLALQDRTDSTHRLDDARKHLGDLNKLDHDLQEAARKAMG